ncbi:NAD(P)-dependent alcohol dehydrogenase (plasmid) [Embleya sp. NBC_00888]|uniref:NAD(P)-dependent alcohol dehydrogenase n=1 Tax=Embleya sp. NBC_00888 TaxID=2975960 RepID=UPI002F90ED3A|nr:NAD(P)-dependent alcohol dehydrogenase [Embleya sp. NBC_00888]
MTTFQAAVLRSSDKPYELTGVTLDELQPHEVLVRVVGSGLCHTDLQARIPGQQMVRLPVILGHEGSGVVERIGAGVRAIKPGDHVVMSFASCGACSACHSGSPAYCARFEIANLTGADSDGRISARDQAGTPIANRWFAQSSFAQYAVATEASTVVIDRDVPLEIMGPLGCSLQTGAGAVLNEMRLAPGQSIVVFGVGAVGLGAIMAAKAAGAGRIIAVDLKPGRLQTALESGATHAVDASTDDLVAAVQDHGGSVDFSFDTTSITEVISAAIRVLARPGSAVLVGGGSGEVRVTAYELAGKHVTFVYEGSAVPQVFVPRLIDLWRRGLFPFDRLIRTYPLSDIDAAEADAISGAVIKPVLIPAGLDTGRPAPPEKERT